MSMTSNLGGIGQMLWQSMVQPFLKLFGHTTLDLTSAAAREELKSRIRSGEGAVTARLERDGMTPALKGDGEAAERQVIRSAMYLLLKEGLQGVGVHKGANVVADQIRDQHDDHVVPMVSPQIDHTTPTSRMVSLTAEALIERMF